MNPEKHVDNKRDAKGRLLKGCTANPHGRPPRGDSWADVFDEVLNSRKIETTYTIAEINPLTGQYEDHLKTIKIDAGKRRDIKELLSHKIIDMAIHGDMRALEDIQDRVRGRPAQSMDLTTAGKEIHSDPIVIAVSEETAKLMAQKSNDLEND